jgi:hypothetical protein
MERRIRRGHGLPLACLFAVVLFVTSGLTAGSAFWGFPSTGAGSSVYSAAGVDAICASNHIHVSVADGISGAGHSSLVILVHNNGSHTCRLLGYPEVQLLDAGGTVAAVASETASGFDGGTPLSTPRPGIELGAGKVASAVLEGTDVPIGKTTACTSYPSYTIALRGMPDAIRIKQPIMSCSGFSVHPFVIGFNGTYPSGEVMGLVPACKVAKGGHGTIGPFVQIEALSGSLVKGMVSVAASPHSRGRFEIILRPGRYLMKSENDPSSRHVTVHSGEAVNLGLYGSCYYVTGVPRTTVVPGQTPPPTTSTTT